VLGDGGPATKVKRLEEMIDEELGPCKQPAPVYVPGGLRDTQPGPREQSNTTPCCSSTGATRDNHTGPSKHPKPNSHTHTRTRAHTQGARGTHLKASSNVHSDLVVGLDSGNTMGRWLMAAISWSTSSLKLPAMVDTPAGHEKRTRACTLSNHACG